MLALPMMALARVVGLYAADRDEVATFALHDALAASGVALAYPRVAGPSLQLFAVVDPSALGPGYRGIAEPPPDAARVPIEQIDVLVLPGLAFAPDGTRLGQGGGHYDRLLADPRLRAVTIGLAFAAQLVPALPREPHDRPVAIVVTEHGAIVSLANSGGPV